ncbi:peptidase inhibitor family I36 protein [Actinomadura sp. B10D3]|uniref:peptidase inhibitor family I36 protein n=1 Tax=Actinomadura sp. B10D3 TaxID=3153557 RepID=UPI00325DB1FE
MGDVRRMTKRLAATTGAAIVASVGFSAVPAQAAPSCSKGRVCMWEDGGWKGSRYVHWKPKKSGAKYQIDWWNGDNEITSIWNRSKYTIRIYNNDNYTGFLRCIGPGKTVAKLPYWQNDKAESAKAAKSC